MKNKQLAKWFKDPTELKLAKHTRNAIKRGDIVRWVMDKPHHMKGRWGKIPKMICMIKMTVDASGME